MSGFSEETSLFCRDAGLFGGNMRLLCRDQGPFAEIYVSFAEIQGFFADERLFCGDTGIFCGNMGIFCGELRLFCWDAGHLGRCRALMQGCRALSEEMWGFFAEIRALLQKCGDFIQRWGLFCKIAKYGALLWRCRGLLRRIGASLQKYRAV